jgi:hypothetical protein
VGEATEPERLYARLCQAVNARDWKAVADCFATDYHSVDHRVLGWEPMGRQAIVDVYHSWLETAPDLQVAFDWIGGDDDHIALRWGGKGHAAADIGGGAAEYQMILVATIRRGQIAFTERFDIDDQGAALACLTERQRQASDPSEDAPSNEGSASPS